MYFDIRARIIRNFFDLDLSLVICLNNGIHQLCGGYSIRHIFNNQCFLVQLFNLCPNPHFSAPFSFIVIAYINHTARLEIGEQFEAFASQMFYGSF